MKVTIDKQSGFCWGVVRTVQIAEQQLNDKTERNVYVLGNIIHNPKEIERLAEKGLRTIQVEDFPSISNSGAKVIIRAHGEPPDTYRAAWDNKIEIIDATCPVVTKLQERVRKFYDQGFQIVIFGKKDHAEVLGVRGVVHDSCVVVQTVAEAMELVQLDKPTVLFSQTTMDRPTFYEVRDALKKKIADLVVDSMENIASEFHAKDTICGQVSGRENQLITYAKSNDVIVFVAGRASSNGKVLFDIAKKANPNTHFVEDITEINPEWFNGANTAGISGATSTPHWYMMQVQEYMEGLTPETMQIPI
ncbi:MAG: 4-hydroxy-3-methylbut-2-enyl diphosphate reductase [Ignavibacteria bacterium]|nr:4-hydroxy-3-methylbut-2-enyl diphosphate reductase [Ignavibacteria bacterium]